MYKRISTPVADALPISDVEPRHVTVTEIRDKPVFSLDDGKILVFLRHQGLTEFSYERMPELNNSFVLSQWVSVLKREGGESRKDLLLSVCFRDVLISDVNKDRFLFPLLLGLYARLAAIQFDLNEWKQALQLYENTLEEADRWEPNALNQLYSALEQGFSDRSAFDLFSYYSYQSSRLCMEPFQDINFLFFHSKKYLFFPKQSGFQGIRLISEAFVQNTLLQLFPSASDVVMAMFQGKNVPVQDVTDSARDFFLQIQHNPFALDDVNIAFLLSLIIKLGAGKWVLEFLNCSQNMDMPDPLFSHDDLFFLMQSLIRSGEISWFFSYLKDHYIRPKREQDLEMHGVSSQFIPVAEFDYVFLGFELSNVELAVLLEDLIKVGLVSFAVDFLARSFSSWNSVFKRDAVVGNVLRALVRHGYDSFAKPYVFQRGIKGFSDFAFVDEAFIAGLKDFTEFSYAGHIPLTEMAVGLIREFLWLVLIAVPRLRKNFGNLYFLDFLSVLAKKKREYKPRVKAYVSSRYAALEMGERAAALKRSQSAFF